MTACHCGLNPAALNASAQDYLDHGGLALQPDSSGDVRVRPCLKPLNTAQTLLDGLLEGSTTLVSFPSGYDRVTVTPIAPYLQHWVGEGHIKQFCFGKLSVISATVVRDAAPITAGAEQPYLVPGITARSVTVTYRLTDLPDARVIRDLQAHPVVLAPNAIPPETFDREHTVTAVLPLTVDGYRVRP
ncbi:hypothetical protein [Deinococcus sp. AB2017081]|uniref:hypothetical protein n=1 Tax=Deinococcus sp. AB2017081 TaxID=3093660 RepID=UPI002ACBFAAF|nr:hypothetical protein [Deinococcus sp. AB2017081]WQE97135.1 hypothetical protein U2P90_18845 [Deinococcus sp. AB2017081]